MELREGDTTLFTFENPASVGAGNAVFTAPPSRQLEPDTTYFLRVATNNSGSGGMLWRLATDNGEDPDATASGWTIVNGSSFDSNRTLAMLVRGAIIPTSPVVDHVEIVSTPADTNVGYRLGETIRIRGLLHRAGYRRYRHPAHRDDHRR